MKIDKKDVDVAGRKLKLTMNRACDHFELKVYMDTGRPAFNGDVSCKDVEPGKPFTLSWPEASGSPVKISVKAFDNAGFFFGPMEFYPWFFDVPHEEVNFDSAKWDVRDSETAKLDKAYRLVDDAVTRCGGFADIKLYVVGYTDTVGGTDYNRGLSLNRAKSIAQWFRHKGVSVPIFFAGFGEEALLVSTPDETDEPRNRRAQYILSIDPPSVIKAPSAPKWEKL
jgi:outer membrane protein OmpA-like peptidoglycan-associated protein